jgi:hypothetical protein
MKNQKPDFWSFGIFGFFLKNPKTRFRKNPIVPALLPSASLLTDNNSSQLAKTYFSGIKRRAYTERY